MLYRKGEGMAYPQGVVRGQRVSREKLAAARQLRAEMTPAERTLWAGIRRRQAGGYRFRRQQIVDGFILDFYCHAAGLAVEVDGAVHLDQVGHDEARDEILLARGIRVVRVTNDDVERDLPAVLTRIESALMALAPPPLAGEGLGGGVDLGARLLARAARMTLCSMPSFPFRPARVPASARSGRAGG